jgi:uncharacterized membrane protein
MMKFCVGIQIGTAAAMLLIIVLMATGAPFIGNAPIAITWVVFCVIGVSAADHFIGDL